MILDDTTGPYKQILRLQAGPPGYTPSAPYGPPVRLTGGAGEMPRIHAHVEPKRRANGDDAPTQPRHTRRDVPRTNAVLAQVPRTPTHLIQEPTALGPIRDIANHTYARELWIEHTA